MEKAMYRIGINIAITCAIDEEIINREERWEP